MRLTNTSSSARRSTSSGLISCTIATGLCASSRQRLGSRSRKMSTTSGCQVHQRFRDKTQSFSCSVLPAFIQSSFLSERSPIADRSRILRAGSVLFLAAGPFLLPLLRGTGRFLRGRLLAAKYRFPAFGVFLIRSDANNTHHHPPSYSAR